MKIRIYILILLFSLLAFEAIPESLYDQGYKILSKFLQIGLLITGFLLLKAVEKYDMKRLWILVVVYVILRVAWFTILYNIVNPNYQLFELGTTSYYDIIKGKLLIHPSYDAMITIVFTIVACSIIISFYKYYKH